MENKVNGQTKCPKCGATDISVNPANGNLVCNFCRHEFEPESYQHIEDLDSLEGVVVEEGAKDINEDFNPVITYKCKCCGAEIVVNTDETTTARCHWCRNVLSINETIENGAVPDAVLPFKISKEEAQMAIGDFVGDRQFFAKPIFKQEFTTDNILGVYLPYMLVNVNGHAKFAGYGEHQTRRYTVKQGKHNKTYYDADEYQVYREFDIHIKDLSIESSRERINQHDSTKTNNIVNSIMPFDTENLVKWDANYLRGYTSEKRDSNVEELTFKMEAQSKDVARFAINKTLQHYDRGVRWDNEHMSIQGQQWVAAYLPVWIYSYYEQDNNLLHYVAVNARTKETMGSVPLDKAKLLITSIIAAIAGLFLMLYLMDFNVTTLTLLGVVPGVMFYMYIYNQYRNNGARHLHELETKSEVLNLQKEDRFTRHRTRLRNSAIYDQNNTSVKG